MEDKNANLIKILGDLRLWIFNICSRFWRWLCKKNSIIARWSIVVITGIYVCLTYQLTSLSQEQFKLSLEQFTLAKEQFDLYSRQTDLANRPYVYMTDNITYSKIHKDRIFTFPIINMGNTPAIFDSITVNYVFGDKKVPTNIGSALYSRISFAKEPNPFELKILPESYSLIINQPIFFVEFYIVYYSLHDKKREIPYYYKGKIQVVKGKDPTGWMISLVQNLTE